MNAAEFLKTVFAAAEGKIEIRAIFPGGRIQQRYFSTPESAAAHANSFGDRANVYVGCGTRMRDSGTKKDVQMLPALWADCDSEESVARLKEFSLQPTIVVETSPGRVHAWWLLNSPLLLEGEGTIATVEGVLRGIAESLHSDKTVAEVARVLRVPETLNLKRNAACTVQQEGGPRYELADFLNEGLFQEPASSNGHHPARLDTAVVLEGVSEGSRDHALFGLACKLRRADIPREMALRLVTDAAGKCTPPFDVQIAAQKVARAYERHQPKGNDKVEVTPRIIPTAVDLYTVPPKLPEFTVSRFVRRTGLHVIWAAPGVGKTYLLLLLIHTLLSIGQRRLFGHPKLEIDHGYRRVLWLGCEEDAGTLRAKADMVLRGMDLDHLTGQIMFMWAPDPKRPITLMDLNDIIEQQGPFDVVVIDTLTGLLPDEMGGEAIRWDADNAAVTKVCLMLRAIAVLHNMDLFLNHHTGRDTSKGYRGPTAWWGAADMLIGLTPNEGGGMTVLVEKCRDDGRVAPFILKPTWGPDGFRITYEGAALSMKLKPTQAAVDAILRERGTATQAELIKATGASRSSVQNALGYLTRVKLARSTGRLSGKSPEYESITPPQNTDPGEAAPGTYDARNAMTGTGGSSARSAQ
ncbi:MAG: AAA family ATPase [Candidatus Polarisedimenticolia bacterium]